MRNIDYVRTRCVQSHPYTSKWKLNSTFLQWIIPPSRLLFTDFRLVHASIDFPFTIYESRTPTYSQVIPLLLLRAIEFVRNTSPEFGHPLFIHNSNLDIKEYETQVSLWRFTCVYEVSFCLSNGTAGSVRVIARAWEQNNWETVYVGLRIHKISRP